MKWLTYKKQIILGIFVLGAGHLLSWITDRSIFINLGWIFFGALFAVHPVWSERVNGHPNIKKYVRIAGLVVIFIGFMLHTGNGDDFWYDRIEESLGLDVSAGIILQGYDDHGGFHGDGTLYAVLEFSNESFENLISAPGGWHPLPLTDKLQTLIYGTWSAESVEGPFIGVTIPKVDSGYWYFYDRQGETVDDDEVLNRSSFNYTIAIYDAEGERLYYCEYDT